LQDKILSHSYFATINLNLNVRAKNCAIQGGNLSLIKNSKVAVFSKKLSQSAGLKQQHFQK